MLLLHLARERDRPERGSLSTILTQGSVQVGDHAVYYTAAGVAESGSAILFLHEAGGNGATWNGQLVGLAAKARCLVPDLPGHGQSTGGGFQSIAAYREAMIGFLDALAIRWPVVLAGVCLGAAIALDLARHAPERVAGVVLAGLKEGGRAPAEVIRQTARGEAPDGYLDGLLSKSASPRLREEQVKRWRTACPAVRHGDLLALATYPVAQALEGVRHPVLLMAGECDRQLPPDGVLRLARRAPQGEAVVMAGAGTLAMVEQPDRFSAHVASFLAQVRPDVPIVPQVAHGGYRRTRPR